jgi:MbtH protein
MNADTDCSNSNQEGRMAWGEEDDTTIYHVVVNHEEQYSIWPEYKAVPLGWRTVGKTGPKPECLDYIREVWTDMRPLSLRRQMEETARRETESAGPMS